MTPEITRLANGLTVASLAMPGKATAAVALHADVGARHERACEHGLAHLFEHMVFKGTLSRDARQIAEAIEDVGGVLNAWTSRETTCFHARVLAEDLDLATTLIAEMIREPRFAPADFESEREVVLSEIGESLDMPDDLVFDHLHETAYPAQGLGRPILGTPDSLAGLAPADLARWRDTHYRGAGLFLVAAGKVEHAALVARAEALLGDLPAAPHPPAEPARWQGGARREGQRGEQVHVALGFEGPAATDPGYHAAQLFAVALGGGLSSRLFQEVRETRGLAYSVSAAHAPHADSGMLSLYCATRPKDAAAALDLARAVAADLAETLSPAELARARAQLRAGVLMGLEGCAGQADWLGRSLLPLRPIIPPTKKP
ncbi:MAG: M16 family metallopeptidase, partial [Sphingomonadaceae bacterium]